MQDILTIGKTVLEGGSTAAFIGLLVVLAVPKLRAKIFGKNGENGHEQTQRLDEIEDKLSLLATNHMEHLQKGIDKMIEMQEAENVVLGKITYLLEDIKENIKK